VKPTEREGLCRIPAILTGVPGFFILGRSSALGQYSKFERGFFTGPSSVKSSGSGRSRSAYDGSL
jgi:hypothetical protein